MESYTPVAYVHREVIQEEIEKGTEGKIFFFDAGGKVDSVEGKIARMEERPGSGIFILMDSDHAVRIDKIVTIFGKPGAAFDTYESLGNACMECHGGYDLD